MENLEDFYIRRAAEKVPTSDNPENDAVITKSLQALNMEDGLRLLDFGCADGFFLSRIELRCPTIRGYGIDLVEHASWKRWEGILSFTASDLALPYADNYFDAFFSLQVLEHLPSVDLAAFELSRVLKPGGRLWIATPNGYDDTWRGFHQLQRHVDIVEGHFRHFSARDLTELFSRYNCEVVQIRYDIFVGLYLYYRFIAYNRAVKKTLLKAIALELSSSAGGIDFNEALPPNKSLLKSLAFAILRGLRRFDEMFSSYQGCRAIEVTFKKRRAIAP